MSFAIPQDELPSLLLVDDDVTFCKVLARSLEKRKFAVTVVHDVDAAIEVAKLSPPEYAIVDLKMSGPSGLVLVKALKELDAETRIVILTGYASIATAVEAIKLGATYYLVPARKLPKNESSQPYIFFGNVLLLAVFSEIFGF